MGNCLTPSVAPEPTPVIKTPEDLAREAYEKSYEQHLSAVTKVTNNRELDPIGGVVVRSSMDEVHKLADAKKWAKAKKLWEKETVPNAALVDERSTAVLLRRKHEDTIKAAMGIKYKPDPNEKSYGEQMKDIWSAVGEAERKKNFVKMEQYINRALALLKTISTDKTLESKQQEVSLERNENQEAMSLLLGKDPLEVGDLETLQEYALKELKLAKEAEALGEDPSAPSREPCSNPGIAKQLFIEYDWFKLKDKLHDSSNNQVTINGDQTVTINKDQMWDQWRYRQKYVTKLIDKLREKHPSLISKASGSTDMESDIDITFAGRGGEEIEAAKKFNSIIKAQFNDPPGIVFDVNIYPRDYNFIKESFNTDFNLTPLEDESIDHPKDEDMARLSNINQDVATLLKQYRFLTTSEYTKRKEAILEGKDKETARRINQQFDEGEDIFLLTAQKKIDAILEGLGVTPSQNYSKITNGALEKDIKVYLELKTSSGSKTLNRMQSLIPTLLRFIEKEHPSEVMEATDAIYLEEMDKLRKDQAKIKLLDNVDATTAEHHPEGDCNSQHPTLDHETWRKAKADELKNAVKKKQFENIIFANEAYMSQGAIEHVVAGIQAKKSGDRYEAQRIIDGLTPQTLTQSYNEQLADFFKDMQSSEELDGMKDGKEKRREIGEAFVHASKYLVRLLDAAELLAGKIPSLRFDFIAGVLKTELPGAAESERIAAVKKKVEDVLYAMRKSSTLPVEVKGEIGYKQVSDLFGVTTIKTFKETISNFGIELDRKVRDSDEYKSDQEVSLDTERQSFGVPPKPTALKDLFVEIVKQLQTADEVLKLEADLDNKGKFQAEKFNTSELLSELSGYGIEGLHKAHVLDINKAKEDLQSRITDLTEKIDSST